MSGPSSADVDRPGVVVLVVVEGRRLVLVDVAGLPEERVVDDRELEALAAVDRQHLDRLGVGLEPPAALLVGACPRPASAIRWRSHAGQRGRRRAARSSPRRAAAGRRGAGRSAGARRRRVASTRSGRPSASVIVSISAATPRCAQHAAPSGAGGGGAPPRSARRRRRDPLGGPAEERGQRGRRARGGRRRALERLEQPQPLARRRRCRRRCRRR